MLALMATLLPLQTPKTPIRRRATVEDLYLAYEQEAPGSTRRMELIDGEIITMPPLGAPHSGFTDQSTDALKERVKKDYFVRCQLPIRISRHSEPQPDIAIVLARKDRYTLSHPTPDDVLLIVEISDSSLQTDLNVKRVLYAKAEIPEYWVIDVMERQLHVFRKPWEADYTEHECLGIADQIQCSTLESVAMPVAELFPPIG